MQSIPSMVGGRIPKQLQRALPFYIACCLFIVFLTSANSFKPSIDTAEIVKRGIAHQTPFRSTTTKFPRKIWQIWKVDPLNFEERESQRARSWTSMNPGYRYEVLTDSNDLHYIQTTYGRTGLNRPDLVRIYRSLTARIIKADLLRYAIMYAEGGVYADIDVEPIRPVGMFVPPQFDERDVDLVIGVEIDEPYFANHTILGPKSRSFCQWAFMCKPRNPIILRTINNVLAWVEESAKKQKLPISELVFDFDDVISGTGPSAFTVAVMEEMKLQTRSQITWDKFHDLQQPIRVGNVLVLTIEAFAAGQGHSNSGDHSSEKAMVRHHFHASLWPSKHPRYSHPAYGPVELCNWDANCVEQWDINVIAFEQLPVEQRQQLIEVKRAAEREQEQADITEGLDNRAIALRAATQQVAAIQAALAEVAEEDQKLSEGRVNAVEPLLPETISTNVAELQHILGFPGAEGTEEEATAVAVAIPEEVQTTRGILDGDPGYYGSRQTQR